MTKINQQILKNIKKMSGIKVFESRTAYYYFKITDGHIWQGKIEFKRSRRVRDLRRRDAIYFINHRRLFKEIKF